MNKIQFASGDAQKIYENYLKQIRSATRTLPAEDQNDIMMELNSHIFESISRADNRETEVSNLVNALDKIGIPGEILKPMVAEKKLEQATKSFNPVHVFQAIMLNLSNGIIYVIFSVLYLFLFSFVALDFVKLFYPDNVGLYYKKGEIFQLGFQSDESLQQYEVLGGYFVPVTILVAIVLYFLITLLLKLKRVLNKTRHNPAFTIAV